MERDRQRGIAQCAQCGSSEPLGSKLFWFLPGFKRNLQPLTGLEGEENRIHESEHQWIKELY
jgi:hypothetical protein